jgi:hypothetical protein
MHILQKKSHFAENVTFCGKNHVLHKKSKLFKNVDFI